MSTTPGFPRLLILIIAAASILALLALLVVSQADKSRQQLPIYGMVPDFEFVDHTGQPFTRHDLLGKISLVYFGFTRCKGPCPVIVGHLKELYDLYAPSELGQIGSRQVPGWRESRHRA